MKLSPKLFAKVAKGRIYNGKDRILKVPTFASRLSVDKNIELITYNERYLRQPYLDDEKYFTDFNNIIKKDIFKRRLPFMKLKFIKNPHKNY